MSRTRAAAWLSLGLVTVLLLGLALVVMQVRDANLSSLGRLEGRADGRSAAAGSEVRVVVDAAREGSPISPLIYGVAFADTQTLKRLGATVNRWGGNTATTFNWTNNCWNAARDWEFRNQPARPGPDEFVRATVEAGASPLITIPTIGWVSRDCDNGTRSAGVPPAGGGPLTPGSAAIAGYDPAKNRSAAYVPSAARGPQSPQPPDRQTVYQDQWVRHLRERSGGPGGSRFYAMDNEPDLWAETHTDIHPAAMGYDEMVRNFEEYATAVKDQDSAALVLGPGLCCWTSLLYSDLDRGGDNFHSHADRLAHGNQAFLPWWLQQIAKRDREVGRRSLDLVDVHFYPQAEGVFSDAASSVTRARRVQSVRSLNDPTYRDESWIGSEINLIPRLKHWIRDTYPGTGLAITEYNFGGQTDASGAVALAEALGVFGREGLDLATYWTYPSPDTPAGAALRLYRNFDGASAAFGDRSLPVISGRDSVRAFASRHSSHKEVDVVLANESLTDSVTVGVDIAGQVVQSVDEFRLAPGSAQIERTQPRGTRVSLAPLGLSLIRVRLA